MDPEGDRPSTELPPPGQSTRILHAMNMGARQRSTAVACRNHLLSRMGATLRRRRDISLELLRTLGGERHENVEVPLSSCQLDFSSENIHWTPCRICL